MLDKIILHGKVRVSSMTYAAHLMTWSLFVSKLLVQEQKIMTPFATQLDILIYNYDSSILIYLFYGIYIVNTFSAQELSMDVRPQ